MLPYPDMEFKDRTKIGKLCRKEIFRPFLMQACYGQGKDVDLAVFKSKMRQYNNFLYKYKDKNKNFFLWDLTKVLCKKV